jgi:hypothetical protein
MMPGAGGMDAEAARMAMNGTMGTNTLVPTRPTPRAPASRATRAGSRGVSRGSAAPRSYVIEAPLAEERDAANDALPGATGVA